MKYILTFLLTFLLAGTAYGATVPWNRTADGISPLYIGDNVGIGTTSPYAKLSIDGETVSSYFTAFDETATSTFIGPLLTYGLAQFGGLYDEDLINENYIATFVKDIDGYANIEIMNPSLGVNVSSDIVLANASSSSDGYYAAFSLGGPNYVDPAFGLLGTPNSASLFSTYPNNALQIAAIGANSYVQIIAGSTSTEPTRFTSSGAVGIGSTSPSARLVVTNPLSTRTVVFEDQALDPSPFAIDATGYVTTGSGMTVLGSLTATSNFSASDYTVNGGDITQNDADMRILSEDSLFLVADRLNNDADTTAGKGIIFGKNTTTGTSPSGANLLGAFNENGNFGIGTTSPKSKLTVVEGDIYIASSTRGIIMKSPDGTCSRGTISDIDALTFTSVTCPD